MIEIFFDHCHQLEFVLPWQWLQKFNVRLLTSTSTKEIQTMNLKVQCEKRWYKLLKRARQKIKIKKSDFFLNNA